MSTVLDLPFKTLRPRILVAPSGFKECADPAQVADWIEKGLRRVMPHHSTEIQTWPLQDGGEGFLDAMVRKWNGSVLETRVFGPMGEEIEGRIGLVDDGATAVIETAQVAGLRLIPPAERCPTLTTSAGVGMLIRKALEETLVTKIIIGCGDTGTVDGGIGLLRLLGGEFWSGGKELKTHLISADLEHIDRIDLSRVHWKLRSKLVILDVVCNIHNVLCGLDGMVRIYGPQKGVKPEDIEPLSSAVDKFAAVAKRCTGMDVGNMPGSGASGGMGAALLLLGARMTDRRAAFHWYFDFDSIMAQRWDLVITGEGRLDKQSLRGKAISEMAMAAKERGIPVICLAGSVERSNNYTDAGIGVTFPILDRPMSTTQAIKRAPYLVMDTAERVARSVLVGWEMARLMDRA
ncbi:glycerate kinase [Podospora didyma]|uniref:Glycerate kinase n=1 Tax=Podospora didyma TaxID=330526 RepID=A0AAE0NY89_9PEZI|nr:glycerate kinase [Podospora didyma]